MAAVEAESPNKASRLVRMAQRVTACQLEEVGQLALEYSASIHT